MTVETSSTPSIPHTARVHHLATSTRSAAAHVSGSARFATDVMVCAHERVELVRRQRERAGGQADGARAPAPDREAVHGAGRRRRRRTESRNPTPSANDSTKRSRVLCFAVRRAGARPRAAAHAAVRPPEASFAISAASAATSTTSERRESGAGRGGAATPRTRAPNRPGRSGCATTTIATTVIATYNAQMVATAARRSCAERRARSCGAHHANPRGVASAAPLTCSRGPRPAHEPKRTPTRRSIRCATASATSARAAVQRSGAPSAMWALYARTRSAVIPCSAQTAPSVGVVQEQRREAVDGVREAGLGGGSRLELVPAAAQARRRRRPGSTRRGGRPRAARAPPSAARPRRRTRTCRRRRSRRGRARAASRPRGPCRSGSARAARARAPSSARCHECSPLFSRREPSVIELRRRTDFSESASSTNRRPRREIGVERDSSAADVCSGTLIRGSRATRGARRSSQRWRSPVRRLSSSNISRTPNAAEHERRADDDEREVALHPADRAR